MVVFSGSPFEVEKEFVDFLDDECLVVDKVNPFVWLVMGCVYNDDKIPVVSLDEGGVNVDEVAPLVLLVDRFEVILDISLEGGFVVVDEATFVNDPDVVDEVLLVVSTVDECDVVDEVLGLCNFCVVGGCELFDGYDFADEMLSVVSVVSGCGDVDEVLRVVSIVDG